MLHANKRERLESVLSYSEDTAGGLMNIDQVTVRADVSLDVVLRYLRIRGELPDLTDQLFVTDRHDHYLGALYLGDLLTNDPEVEVKSIMRTDIDAMHVHMSDNEVAREFENFDLFLEFHIDATTNSGVFIRCVDRSAVDPRSCYEVNIYDEHPQQQARTGAIVLEVMPPLVHVETVNRWNTLQIRAEGPVITVRVNDRITALMHAADQRAGFIALQHWNKGEVRFRNIRLQPL